jgi:hypothetical protein
MGSAAGNNVLRCAELLENIFLFSADPCTQMSSHELAAKLGSSR